MSTQNINVADLARKVVWDFSVFLQTLWHASSYEKLMIKKDREKWSSYFLFFFKKIIFSEAQKKNFFICREGKGKKFCNIVSCYNFLLLFIELTSQLHPSCLCLAGLATVFENQRKSLIHHCEHSELSLLKVTLKCQKLVDFGEFLKTVLPDRSVLIRQNLWKMPK